MTDCERQRLAGLDSQNTESSSAIFYPIDWRPEESVVNRGTEKVRWSVDL